MSIYRIYWNKVGTGDCLDWLYYYITNRGIPNGRYFAPFNLRELRFTLDLSVQKQVYSEFYKLVYRVILYSVNDHAATEDIIQEAFLKVVQNVPDVQNELQLRGWIKVVVRNTTYNYLRKNH